MPDNSGIRYHVGYETGTAAEVSAELHHLAIFGLTQKSGKTTALEAFINRIDGKASALIFRTGRGEIGFSNAVNIPFFFRERTDWQFVEGMISAHLHEKARFYRGDIMRACQGAKSLNEIWTNVRTSLKKAKEGTFVQKIYTELDQYLNEIVPSLGRMSFSSELALEPGTVHVMDLEDLKPSMQQLIIAATIDRVMEKLKNVIIVLPEARDFIPEDRRTPAKLSVENLIRKGAKLGNYLWCDSQALTGLDLDVMRNVGVWMFGRQDLDREAERSSRSIPGKTATANDIRSLKVGEFYLVQGESVKKVYVQPVWASDTFARNAASGAFRSEYIEMRGKEHMDQDSVGDSEDIPAGELRKRIIDLEAALRSKELEIAELKELNAVNSTHHDDSASGTSAPNEIDLEAGETVVKVKSTEPDVRSFSTSRVNGKVIYVLLNDLSEHCGTMEDISLSMKERGWNVKNNTLAPEIGKLVKQGTIVKSEDRPAKYRLPGKLQVEVEELN